MVVHSLPTWLLKGIYLVAPLVATGKNLILSLETRLVAAAVHPHNLRVFVNHRYIRGSLRMRTLRIRQIGSYSDPLKWTTQYLNFLLPRCAIQAGVEAVGHVCNLYSWNLVYGSEKGIDTSRRSAPAPTEPYLRHAMSILTLLDRRDQISLQESTYIVDAYSCLAGCAFHANDLQEALSLRKYAAARARQFGLTDAALGQELAVTYLESQMKSRNVALSKKRSK